MSPHETRRTHRPPSAGRPTLVARPGSPWSGRHGHTVQFYHQDAPLEERVGEFLRQGLDAGCAAVAIATAPRIQRLREALGPRASRVVFLDATATADDLLVDGHVDAARFEASVASCVAAAATEPQRPVHTYGELVAVLAGRGLLEAAVELEKLWNALARRLDIELLCSYPLRTFGEPGRAAAFARVVGEHARALPAEDFPQDGPEEGRLRRIVELQRLAHAFQLEADSRRLTQERLARREDELRDLVENAAEGIHQVGPDGTILWANAAELQMLGYRPEEYIGHNIREFHADERVLADIMDSLGRGETVRDRPARLRAKDGTVRHVVIHSSGRFAEGRLVATRCFTRDVTDRVRLEEARRAAGQLLETMSDGFLQVDGEWRITYANPSARQGRRREDLEGHVLWELFPAVRGTVFEERYRASMQKRQRVTFEAYFAPLGAWMENTVLPAGDGLWIYYRDVSERHRAEEELRIRNRQQAAVARLGQLALATQDHQELLDESAETIAATLEVEFAAILELDASGESLSVRAAVGWPSAIVGSTVPAEGASQAARTLHSKEPFVVEDMSGDARIVQPPIFQQLGIRSGLSVVLPGRDGPCGVIGAHTTSPRRFTADDITFLQSVANLLGAAMERRRTEEELRRHRDHLEDLVAERTRRLAESYRELESFNYSVSHDLRTPLRAIAGLSGLLAQRHGPSLDEGARRLVAQVQEEAVRMGTLIQELLDLARYHRLDLAREEVDLSTMAEEVLASLAAAQPNRKVHWTVQPTLLARGDPNLLRVVLENLLGNAWKFTARRADATIEVVRIPGPGGLTVAVRDNGAGFDMTYARKLFQPFQRLHGPAEFEGTGIGLATVARIVTRHGGRVWAEGRVDKGATFYFTLPPA